MAAEQDARLHRRFADCDCRAGDGPKSAEDERDRGQDPDAATCSERVAWHERVTGHGHST
jgi:hypothetical protein